MDEPTEGLAPRIATIMADCIRDIHRRGVSVVLVEQKLAIAPKISQHVALMGHGRTVFEGAPEQMRENLALLKEWGMACGHTACRPASRLQIAPDRRFQDPQSPMTSSLHGCHQRCGQRQYERRPC